MGLCDDWQTLNQAGIHKERIWVDQGGRPPYKVVVTFLHEVATLMQVS